MNNQKVVAIFLASIMLISILPILFGGSSQSTTDEEYEINVVGFDEIPGEKISHEFDSISDALEMSPEGIIAAQYVDYENIDGTPLEFVAGNSSQISMMYNSNVKSQYIAGYSDGTSFEMHSISPEIVAFPYTIVPETYNDYQLLNRYNNIYTVIGNPMVFGPKDKVESVVDVVSGNMESNYEFNQILTYTDSSDEFQFVSSSPDIAEQIYIGINMVDSTQYSKTTVYLNATESTLENVTGLQGNSTERGLVYDTTVDGDFTKVVVTSNNIFALMSEPSW